LMQLDFSPPIPPRPGKSGLAQMTQEVADWFTTGIRADPTDWHMLQAIFTADLDRVAAAGADDAGGTDVADGDEGSGRAESARRADVPSGTDLPRARVVGDGPADSESERAAAVRPDRMQPGRPDPGRPDRERPSPGRPSHDRSDRERSDSVRPDRERPELGRSEPGSRPSAQPRGEPDRDHA
jgi:hypothetical protein